MLIDGLVVYLLTVWERRLKEDKAKIVEKENMAKEEDKKDKRATKAATRQQRKAEQMKTKHQNQSNRNSSNPKHQIMQPDKSKKM